MKTNSCYLGLASAGGAVAVIAVLAAMLLSDGPSRHAPQPIARSTRIAEDPHEEAVHRADAIMRDATVPPKARRVDHSPAAALDQPRGGWVGPNVVERARFWVAPESVRAAARFVMDHPPAGFVVSSQDSDRRERDLYLESGDQHSSLQYVIVAFRGGVAVRADSEALWRPLRSADDVVPGSATSVDVLVVRQKPWDNPGAPTVRQTLTGAAAQRLAAAVNELPRPIDVGCVGGPGGGREWYDRLVFHAEHETVRVRADLSSTCQPITFWAGRRPPIQLESGLSYDNLNETILSALGLPANYGDR